MGRVSQGMSREAVGVVAVNSPEGCGGLGLLVVCTRNDLAPSSEGVTGRVDTSPKPG